MQCIHIHIEGQVQGVGFRPFVYRLAQALQLKGWVCNGVDGVHVEAEGDEETLRQFRTLLQEEYPPIARITRFVIEEKSLKYFTDFKIIESSTSGKPNLLITPDFGLCDSCRHELHDTANQRHHYPFITCTQCGPRYSIIQSLPYDRPTTSMRNFRMCTHCEEEYHNPLDKRYYSQTNSCPHCTIDTWLVNNSRDLLAHTWEEAFPLLLSQLQNGSIIAMKGIGGYLLLTDATNASAIEKLQTSPDQTVCTDVS